MFKPEKCLNNTFKKVKLFPKIILLGVTYKMVFQTNKVGKVHSHLIKYTFMICTQICKTVPTSMVAISQLVSLFPISF